MFLRDRKEDFEPQIVKKNQTDISNIEDQVLSMYAKGMTTKTTVWNVWFITLDLISLMQISWMSIIPPDANSTKILSTDLLLANIYLNIGISLLPVQQAVGKPTWLVLLAWKRENVISLPDMSAFQICLLIWKLPGLKGTTGKSWLNMQIHWCSFSMNGFF